jgi:DnaJ-domain-containing protein 1
LLLGPSAIRRGSGVAPHARHQGRRADLGIARARKALGVGKGATKEQVAAAHRVLAHTHHPDKVASLQPEAREYSERRMKEINIAYAELRREWNDRASGEARTR